MSNPHDPEKVRELAYKLWVDRGGPEDGAERDWLEAERQLAGTRKTDIQDEVAKESFPASDPPSTGLPDKPPANAGEKWRAANAAKTRKRRGKTSAAASNGVDDTDDIAHVPRETTPKLGSRDAPGG